MGTGEKDPGVYVRKVQEGTHRYAQSLLAENEKLRARVAQLETDGTALAQKFRTLDALLLENAGLRAENASLQAERRLLEERTERVRESIEAQENRYHELQARLDGVEQENRRFTQEYLAIEQQNSHLANVYVASYRLHGTVERSEFVDAVKEIIANLVGSEELAIFERENDGRTLSLVGFNGIDPEPLRRVAIGKGIIGRTAETGETHVGSGEDGRPEEAGLTACIPLTMGGAVIGVIAVFRLLAHKAAFEAVDREIFDLLSSQAGIALYCTRLHAALLASASEAPA